MVGGIFWFTSPISYVLSFHLELYDDLSTRWNAKDCKTILSYYTTAFTNLTAVLVLIFNPKLFNLTQSTQCSAAIVDSAWAWTKLELTNSLHRMYLTIMEWRHGSMGRNNECFQLYKSIFKCDFEYWNSTDMKLWRNSWIYHNNRY